MEHKIDTDRSATSVSETSQIIQNIISQLQINKLNCEICRGVGEVSFETGYQRSGRQIIGFKKCGCEKALEIVKNMDKRSLDKENDKEMDKCKMCEKTQIYFGGVCFSCFQKLTTYI
jgi:hypothetical protein